MAKLAVQMGSKDPFYKNSILGYTLVQMVQMVLYHPYLLYFIRDIAHIRIRYTWYTLVHFVYQVVSDNTRYRWYSCGTDAVFLNIMYSFVDMVQMVRYRWYRWYRWYTSNHTHTPNHTHTLILTIKIITS